MEFLSLQQGASKVLRLTQRMLEMAEQGEWDALGQLEQERSRSLESLFQHPQIPDALHTIAHALQQVVELDRQCIALGQQARDAMAAELKLQSQAQHAVRTYLDCQN
jgi:hypothetical protein